MMKPMLIVNVFKVTTHSSNFKIMKHSMDKKKKTKKTTTKCAKTQFLIKPK